MLQMSHLHRRSASRPAAFYSSTATSVLDPIPGSTRGSSSANPYSSAGLSRPRKPPRLSSVPYSFSRFGRTRLRTVLLLAIVGLLYLLIYGTPSVRRRSAPEPESWPAGRDPNVPPTVEREQLERLRLLEVYMSSTADADPQDVDRMGDSPIVPTDDSSRHTPSVDAIPVDAGAKQGIGLPMVGEPMPAAEIDRIACPERGGQPCSFLVPAWLGEQETKAQIHVHQLGMLALALNRTLVLPNVIRSRVGTCYQKPFEYYYAADALEKMGVRTIRQYDFAAWSLRRVPRPSGQIVSLVGAKSTYPNGAMEIDSQIDPSVMPGDKKHKHCLAPPRAGLDFSRHSPLSVYPADGYHKSTATKLAFGESLINTLRSPEVDQRSLRTGEGAVTVAGDARLPASVDALVFFYELRYTILTPDLLRTMGDLPAPAHAVLPFSHFPYAPVWSQLAEHIASMLSPFVAIHWRQETVPASSIGPCANSLAMTLRGIQKRYPKIQSVYLATDYPLEAVDGSKALNTAQAHSGTFGKLVTEQHHAAMRSLVADFDEGRVNGLRLVTFARLIQAEDEFQPTPELAEALRRAGAADLNKLDPGLLGIVDKGVAMAAEVFVSGFYGATLTDAKACAKESSFTRQIWAAREAKFEAQRAAAQAAIDDGEEPVGLQPGTIWNPATFWNIKGPTSKLPGDRRKPIQ